MTALLLVLLAAAPGRLDSLRLCPTDEQYATGTVWTEGIQYPSYGKSSGYLFYCANWPYWHERRLGFAKFSLAGIPDSSRFVAARFEYYQDNVLPTVQNTWVAHPWGGVDPVVTEAEGWYQTCTEYSQSVSASACHSQVGWVCRDLDQVGLDHLREELPCGWMVLAVIPHIESGHTGSARIVGGTGQPLSPCLAVQYVAHPWRDALVDSIIAPPAFVDSGTSVTPAVRFTNWGTCPDSFAAWLEIGDDYRADTTLSLSAGEMREVEFASWDASTPGRFTLRCSTALAGDQDPANDLAERALEVTTGDAMARIIYAPRGTRNQGTVLQPLAGVKNVGTARQVFGVRMRIEPGYLADTTVTVDPGEEKPVRFREWIAEPAGRLAVVCSTMLTNDRNPDNDRIVDSVEVVPVGITERTGQPTLKPCLAVTPCPASRRARISYSLGSPPRADLSVLDVAGREIWTRRLAGGQTGTIQLPLLPAGVYIVRLHDSSLSAKLVVQR